VKQIGPLPRLKRLTTQAHQFELVELCPNLTDLEVTLPHNAFHAALYASLQWAPILHTLKVTQSPPFANANAQLIQLYNGMVQGEASPYDSILQSIQTCLSPLAIHRPVFLLHSGKPASIKPDSPANNGPIFSPLEVTYLKRVLVTQVNKLAANAPPGSVRLDYSCHSLRFC